MFARFTLLAAVVLGACTSSTPVGSAPPSASSTSQVAPSPTAAATAPSTARSRVADLASLLESHVVRWTPTGPALIIGSSHQRDIDIVAVPLDGAAAVVLATIHDLDGGVPASVPLSVRPDGAYVAIAVADSLATRRIALLDLASGTARWLSSPAPDEVDGPVVWAPDGTLYFARHGSTGPDLGIAHFTLDGTARAPIPPTSAFGSFSSVSFATTDALIGDDEFNGSTAWSLDLATGTKLSYEEHNSVVWAVRATRPRLLVGVFTTITAPGVGYLGVWDEATNSRSMLVPAPVGGADFDPTGAQIVAATLDASDQQQRLVVMRADGSAKRILAGTEDARWPLWTPSGIAYVALRPSGDRELRLVASSGGATKMLFSGPALSRPQFISDSR